MTNVLLVEDNSELRFLMKVLLEAKKLSVIEAQNGAVGLHLALEKHPDLIICDIDMPVMNGLNVLQEIRKYPSTAELPFVFVTGRINASRDSADQSIKADAYLSKPFNNDEFWEIVESLLN
ncbi:MAG: response regulator [Leptolyngbyaceae cyanobacterium MO_188.B28]|nr:response regulator [Leptolyngbyaceae cyanobacterium MO_188.B28]